ncbi:MAG: Asp-tRNA(Asn)/Glu-tRNA(Gln) amidotransferase subunit GatC [Bdellovibrionales bacterium]
MVDLKAIHHIAKLARLQFTDEQALQFSEQITKILDDFQKISQLPTDGVEPLVTPTQIENFWRDDVVQKEFSSDEMVQNAPSRQGKLFKVPPVVG